MSDILGTTTSLNNYLSKNDITLTINPNEPQKQEIFLSKNRIYKIPLFQREIRWNTGNLNVLLSDLLKGSRFLGNIILSIRRNNIYEIIDGQQRTTVIRMIIECIKSKFGEGIGVFDLCPIDNQSFPGFEKLASVGFDENKLDKEELDEILRKDVYKQIKNIRVLWKEMNDSPILSDRYQAKTLIDNLRTSTVNIIASHSDSEDISIRYFLDVNLKGVQLDTEDIFKGYLFSQDSRDVIRTLWQENKKLAFKFNELKMGEDEKRYPLMKIYEHFFYCDLYLPKATGQDFSNLKFGENFCLTTQFEDGPNRFFEGTHVIEAICNNTYLFNSLVRIKKSLEIMINVAENEGPNDDFKKLFNCPERIDSIDISNCHAILQKILLDKAIIPKVLAMKYILHFFDGEIHEKTDYKSIYTVFVASVLFTIFANKKESETFYSIIRSESWVEELNKCLYSYLSSHELTRSKLLAAYKYSEAEDFDNQQQIRCKSLAAITNFVQLHKDKDKITLKVSNCKEFNDFLKDKTKFSVEHLIIGENGTLNIKTSKHDFMYTYPTMIKRYRNSIFNYIFIPSSLNSDLGNILLGEKIKIVLENEEKIDCSYTKMYCELLNKDAIFVNYPTIDKIDIYNTKEEVIEVLNSYFEKEFPEEILEFSSNLMRLLNWNT